MKSSRGNHKYIFTKIAISGSCNKMTCQQAMQITLLQYFKFYNTMQYASQFVLCYNIIPNKTTTVIKSTMLI